jgi:hypothetical protein
MVAVIKKKKREIITISIRVLVYIGAKYNKFLVVYIAEDSYEQAPRVDC